jgi:serine/threonine protein kinase
MPLEAGDPREIGGYRVVARLGAGGMGQVYLGTTRSGRRLAIKVIRADYADDPEFRRRFRQEVDAAGRVQSIYTAAVVDADPDAVRPWLATAYVPGPSLSRAVDEQGPLPVETVRVLMAGIAEALQAVHAVRIVHRDLKPSNVLLAADGPRVIDFGIARAADSTPLTRAGSRIGSPQFMAPEQATGGTVGEPADVFALGATAYYAATGKSPFGDGDPSAILYRIVHQEPDLTGCPPELLPLVGSCLAKEPDERPSVRAVLDALTENSEATALDWLPPSLTPRIRIYQEPLSAPSRSRRRLLPVAAAAVAVLATVTAITMWASADPDDAKAGPGPTTGSPSTPTPTPTRTPNPTRPAKGSYRFDRPMHRGTEWTLTLARIKVDDDTLTAYVDFRPVGRTRNLTCKGEPKNVDVLTLRGGTSVPSTKTYCSEHSTRGEWSVPLGKVHHDHAVFPLTDGLTKPFTLEYQPSMTLHGTVKGILLKSPG